MTAKPPSVCLTGFLLLMFLMPVPSQAQSDGKTRPLFLSHEVMDVRIEAPLSSLTSDRPEEEYLEGTFTYPQSDGTERTVDLKLRTRGRYRRQKKTCSFPPVRLNFATSQLEGTEFEGQDKLKLVTHCRSTRDQFEQHLLREYLAYRILQTLTERSFGARLMHITYVDTEGDDPVVRYGFVIEDDDDIGERIGLESIESKGLSYSNLEPAHTNLVNVFQYLIGNTDFSLIRGPADDDCCHNAVPFSDGTMIWPIPYDFDFAGLVDAPYAEPNPQLDIRSVRTRLYRGRCSNNGILPDTLDYVVGKKAEIYAVLDELTGLDDKNRKRVTGYLDDFFELAVDPKQVERRIVRECS